MAALLERDSELALLDRRLDEAASGHGHVVVVAGEAGIGKSELVATFLGRHPGGRRAVGRCDALATPRALGPFLDIARSLRLAASGERDELFGELVDDLAGRPQPTTVVVEDAHWADAVSVELLAMLGRRAGELPLLLVVTVRDEELTGDHPLGVAIGNLVTSRTTAYVQPAPLSPPAVEALASGTGLDAATLHARTGGNPFHVTEVLAAPARRRPACAWPCSPAPPASTRRRAPSSTPCRSCPVGSSAGCSTPSPTAPTPRCRPASTAGCWSPPTGASPSPRARPPRRRGPHARGPAPRPPRSSGGGAGRARRRRPGAGRPPRRRRR